MPVEHVTGSERAEIERQFGPLQQVGDRGDLVRVPDEISKEHRAVDQTGDLTGIFADPTQAHDAVRSPVQTDVESAAKGGATNEASPQNAEAPKKERKSRSRSSSQKDDATK